MITQVSGICSFCAIAQLRLLLSFLQKTFSAHAVPLHRHKLLANMPPEVSHRSLRALSVVWLSAGGLSVVSSLQLQNIATVARHIAVIMYFLMFMPFYISMAWLFGLY